MSLNYTNFVKLVKQFEEDYDIGEMVYYETLKRLKNVRKDLSRLNDDMHLKGVMRQFLTVWGGMGRVVERKKEELDWKGLGDKLQSLRDDFKKLNKKSLCELKDHDFEVIENIYKTIHDSQIKYLRGPTTLSKILHVLNPEVFLMWDDNIREKIVEKVFAVNLGNDVEYDGEDNADGYRKYIKDTRNLLLKAFGKECSQITKLPELGRYKKSLAKLIDEFYFLSVNL